MAMTGILGAMPSAAYGMMPKQPEEQKGPSFFGEGGTGRAIAGSIGDYLLQMNRMAPVYAPTMQRRQDLMQQQQAAEQQRKAKWEDWIKQQKYTRDNPQASPTTLQRNYEYLKTIRPDLAGGYLEGQANPMQWQRVENPDGSVQLIPMPRTPSAAPQKPQSDGRFLDMGGFQSMYQSMGPQGFSDWQGKHGVGVKVNSEQEYNSLPPGTRYIAPDGSVRVKN